MGTTCSPQNARRQARNEWNFERTEDDSTPGVSHGEPAGHCMHRFREAVSLGRTDRSPREVLQILAVLQREWPGGSYHLLKRNCIRNPHSGGPWRVVLFDP